MVCVGGKGWLSETHMDLCCAAGSGLRGGAGSVR